MTCATPRKTRPWEGLTAKDVMEVRVVSVSPSSPLSELERLLTEHRISGMPVIDASGRAVGVVSYRDLLDHYAEGLQVKPHRESGLYRLSTGRPVDDDFGVFGIAEREACVADVMTPAIVDVSTDASMQEICRTMARNSVHRLVVTDPESGRMVGILSSLSVLAAIAEA